MRKQTFIQPGDKFNRLTAMEFSHTGKHSRRYFKFLCDCGKEKIITAEAVISGNTKSCGCLASEVRRSKILPENKGVINQIILGYKRHALDRGFLFELSYDTCKSIFEGDCFYCGDKPSNNKITKNCNGYKYNGIDRIDSKKNYTTENVVPCCKICNNAKSDLSLSDFSSWVTRLKAMAAQWSK